MGMISGPQNKKNLNVELNLLPVFDVLSVCICFLLMTVVWIEIRSMETKQAIGSQAVVESDKSASVAMTIDDQNNLSLVIKPAKGPQIKSFVATKAGKIDVEKARAAIAAVASQSVKRAQILPSKSTKYDQVIQLMDLTKQSGIIDIGLSPI